MSNEHVDVYAQARCKHGTRLTLHCTQCKAEGATLQDRLDAGRSMDPAFYGPYGRSPVCKHGVALMSHDPCTECRAETAVPSWDNYNMVLAMAAARRSKDRSTKLGCVIVGPDNEPRSWGYNGFPRGINDNVEERHQRPEKYLWTEHAERNAIYGAARHGTALKGCTLYVPWIPCMDCGRAIVQVGIVRVLGYAMRLDDPKWAEEFKRVVVLFEEAGVDFKLMPHLPTFSTEA